MSSEEKEESTTTEPAKDGHRAPEFDYTVVVKYLKDDNYKTDEEHEEDNLSDGQDPLGEDSDGSSNAEKQDYAIDNMFHNENNLQDSNDVTPWSLSATTRSNSNGLTIGRRSAWSDPMLEPFIQLSEDEENTEEPFWKKQLRQMAESPTLASDGNDSPDSASIGESSIEDLPILDFPLESRRPSVEFYTSETGPQMYMVKGNVITQPLILKNLPALFSSMPVCGRPQNKGDLNNLLTRKMKAYMGSYLGDKEFKKWELYCSRYQLYNGHELLLKYDFPSQGSLASEFKKPAPKKGPVNLCIVKKLRMRISKDKQNHYPRRLKYRGMRLMPLSLQVEDPQPPDNEEPSCSEEPTDPLKETDPLDLADLKSMDPPKTTYPPEHQLEPGKDLLYRVRFYRPFSYGAKEIKPNRHSVFSHDLVATGRHTLQALRDHIRCPNDAAARVDVSRRPDRPAADCAQKLFPSNFLFINNVFYVDERAGCADHSAAIREWARARRLGSFPRRPLAAARLRDLVLRLGHPEVYVHQGNCEHLFVFSEVRLLSPADPLQLEHYPCHTAISQNQSVYCTTCAEFGAKWVVVGCARVPFDPAFFCDTCFKLYLYDRDGNKIGDFKAYAFKPNEVNFSKPMSSDD